MAPPGWTWSRALTVVAVALIASSCSGREGAEPAAEGCADVVAVEIEPAGDGLYRVIATVASADTGWEKYADRWEVRTGDGTVLAVRELTHPHEDEQPFTRSLGGVRIPAGTESVVIAARDSVAGYCGATFTAEVPPPG